MNIAIPVYENRVMPRFGCTREMIIVSVENGKIVSKKRLTITLQAGIPEITASEQVSVVICEQEAVKIEFLEKRVLIPYPAATIQGPSAYRRATNIGHPGTPGVP